MEEINLKELFNYFLSKITIIIAITVAAILVSILYRGLIKVPMYESYTTIVLTRTDDTGADTTSGGITQNDILLNQKLVATYREIMKSRRILDQVMENLDLDTSYEKLKSQITVVNEEDTEILKISVDDKDKTQAQDIANEIARVFSNEIVEIYSIKNISIIDYAKEDDVPYNINPLKETVLAGGLGFVLSCLVVFMIYYFDTTVKSSEDIETKINLPVLGVVPKNNHGKKGGSK